jgi:phosphatidylserine/phosphatidylglycerophosphate/cardiolipin synthase-like enzyme
LLEGLKLHGKMLLSDEKRAIVGSINLSPAASIYGASSPSKPMPITS